MIFPSAGDNRDIRTDTVIVTAIKNPLNRSGTRILWNQNHEAVMMAIANNPWEEMMNPVNRALCVISCAILRRTRNRAPANSAR
jgi:hypothetical protein